MSQEQPRQAAIVFILVVIFIDVLAIGIIIPVLPNLVKELVGDANQAWWYGVIAASYALMQFLFSPVLGALSDRFGRRPVLLGSMFGLGADFVVQGLAPSVGWLLGGRLFGGVMGASITTANAYIADISTDEDRAKNFGLVGAAFGLGFIIGPALGGTLGAELGTRSPFFVSAGLALINGVYGLWILPESLKRENRSELNLRNANPFGSLQRLRKHRVVFGLAVAMFFTALAQRGLENVWVMYTEFRYGWDPKTNGFMLGLVGLTAAVVQGGLVRSVIQRLGERRTVTFGICVSCVAFLGYGLATHGYMIPVVIIFGSLGGVTRPAIQTIISKTVDDSEQGRIQGALTSLISLTSIIAPLIFTSGLYGYFTSPDAPFQLPGAPFLAGSALFFVAVVVATRVFKVVPETVASN